MIKALHLIYVNAIFTYKGRMWLSAILTGIFAFAYNKFMYPILSDIAFVFLMAFLLHFIYWLFRGINNEL